MWILCFLKSKILRIQEQAQIKLWYCICFWKQRRGNQWNTTFHCQAKGTTFLPAVNPANHQESEQKCTNELQGAHLAFVCVYVHTHSCTHTHTRTPAPCCYGSLNSPHLPHPACHCQGHTHLPHQTRAWRASPVVVFIFLLAAWHSAPRSYLVIPTLHEWLGH